MINHLAYFKNSPDVGLIKFIESIPVDSSGRIKNNETE